MVCPEILPCSPLIFKPLIFFLCNVFFLSGQTKDFFSLKQYKTEVGKDYKRLVFYLCNTDNFSAYEKHLQESPNTSEGPSEDDCQSTADEFPSMCEQIELDEAIARTLQDELN